MSVHLPGLSDRMLVMSRGIIAGEVPRDRFDEEAILAMAYQEYTRATNRETLAA